LACSEFSTVHTLEFSRAMATQVDDEVGMVNMYHAITGRNHFAWVKAPTFQSLQIIVLPLEVKRDKDIQTYRMYFDKPDLEASTTTTILGERRDHRIEHLA